MRRESKAAADALWRTVWSQLPVRLLPKTAAEQHSSTAQQLHSNQHNFVWWRGGAGGVAGEEEYKKETIPAGEELKVSQVTLSSSLGLLSPF